MATRTVPANKLGVFLAGIARDHVPQLRARGFRDLEARGSDSLDFLDVAVRAIREALEEACTCGFADADAAHGLRD